MAQREHADLLVEIGCEEIPATFIRPALEQFQALLSARLTEARLSHGATEVYGTPRRLILLMHEVATHQEAEERLVRGPARRACFDEQGHPTPALLGFCRSQGVEPEQVQFVETAQGEYAIVPKVDPGRPAIQILAELLPAVLTSLSFPKMLRWGEGNLRFARPIRWIVALLDTEGIPFELAGVRSGNHSRGHRFLAPKVFPVRSPLEFFTKLKEAFVLYDPEERKQRIRQGATQLAEKVKGRCLLDEELLEENAFLVEYPYLLLGSFPEEFLALPTPVLISAMKKHEKFFPIVDNQGKLLPYFISVYNNGEESRVREGNEWVLVARFNDAKFFYEEDRKQPLEAFVPKLARILFQQQLGSLLDKVQRLAALGEWLIARLHWSEEQGQTLRRAIHLCKADLATQMVMEFPDLQGIIGREYALLSGEPSLVAEAIGEHYRPRYAEDELPRTPVGRALAVLDRIDTLVGYVGLGYLPKGSSDPFGLRRAANGAVEILAQEKEYPTLLEWVQQCYEQYRQAGVALRPLQEVKSDLNDLFLARLSTYLEEQNIPYDLIRAALAGGWDDSAYAAVQRGYALQLQAQSPDFDALATTAVRPANILNAAAKQGIPCSESLSAVEPDLFEHEIETKLYTTLERLIPQVEEAEGQRDYERLYRLLQQLDEPVNRFFDYVMVMCEDEQVRQNRLNLLACANRLYRALADFTQVMMPRPR